MEEITRRLQISKGSASQGLRYLEELAAISRQRPEGERSHTYIANLELKPLLGGFLSKRLIPRLTDGNRRLERLKELLPAFAPAERTGASLRVHRITKWHKRAAGLLPLAQKILGY